MQVETKRATPREEFGKPEAGITVKKVFVGGLKEDMEDEDLREYFSMFGNVTEVTRLTEKDTGKKRGFGFVEFDDYDPVDKCIQKVIQKKDSSDYKLYFVCCNIFYALLPYLAKYNIFYYRGVIKSVAAEWM